jgi:hypothetical protein
MAYNNKKNFNLNNYETVKSRKVRLRTDHPDSFILPMPMSDLNYAANFILMGALIWKDKKTFTELSPDVLTKITEIAAHANPQNSGVILTSIALIAQADGAGYSLSIAGGQGADKSAWVENAEESAVGRALDNMGYHSGSASQEEIKKVEHMQEAQQTRVQLENQINHMYGQLMAQGHNSSYLTQVTSQSVTKPFSYLSELSPDDLQKLLSALQSVRGSGGAYQQQQQQAQYQQTPPPPGGVLGVPAPVR